MPDTWTPTLASPPFGSIDRYSMVATPRMDRPFALREGSQPQLERTFEYLGPPPNLSFHGAVTCLLPLFLIVILNEAVYTESPLDHEFSVLILTWQGLLNGFGS